MKKSLFALLGASALLVSNSSAAILVAGWHAFDNNSTASEAPDSVSTGFSGLVVKNTYSVSPGGDNDGTYGNSSAWGVVPSNDGYARVTTAANLYFTVTNNNASAVQLTSLLFDAVSSQKAGGGTYDFTISYSLNGGTTWTALSTVNPALNANGFNPNQQEDFSDFVLNLSSVTLASAATIQFRFEGQGRIDNVALIAVPETSSTIALGGLLGAGVFFRSRRRSVIA